MVKNLRDVREKPRRTNTRPRTVTMQLRNGVQTLDAYRPTFDPHLDIATVVFSHVQCVKTRVNLAVVSKLWRDASKPAAAYPRTFDFDAFPDMFLRMCAIYGCLRPTGQRRSSVSTLRESRWTSWCTRCEPRMLLRCSPGECKAAEVDAREQP